MARALLGLLLALAGGLARDERSTDEILQEILAQRDWVDLALFEVLGEREDEHALDALEQGVLALGNPKNLDRAFRAFRHFRGVEDLGPRARAWLAEEARRGYVAKRRAAVRALVLFGDDAEGELFGVLDDVRDLECREVAVGGLASALGAQHTEESLETLIALFHPPTSGSEEELVRALAPFVEADFVDTLEAALKSRRTVPEVKVGVLRTVAQSGLEGVDAFFERGLSDRDVLVVAAALDAVARRGAVAFLPQVERLARSRDPVVRYRAVRCESTLRADGKEWRERLAELAQERDAALRTAAAEALGTLGEPAPLDLAHALLLDPVMEVRAAALRSVATLRESASIEHVLGVLERDSLRMRERAREVLAEWTGEDRGLSVERWRGVFEEEGYALGTPEEARARRAELEAARAEVDTEASFYGIRLQSDRVVFVLDVSGSMDLRDRHGERRIDALTRELVATLESFPDGGRFNLVFFSDRISPWRRELTTMDERRRQDAVRYVKRLQANGGTAVYEALERAFEEPEADTVVLLTDGEPTEGRVQEPMEILREIRRWCLFRDVVVHCISLDLGSRLLEDLARENGGEYREVR